MGFREVLKSGKVVFLDGAMGTRLEQFGLQGKLDANLTDPEKVVSIHRDYFGTGCQAVLTNTMLLNPEYAGSHDFSGYKEANWEGVELAKSVAGPGRFVIGDMSTTGLFDPLGEVDDSRFSAAFEEQSGLLSEAGVDALIIETMTDLREAVLAVMAAKKTGLPVMATMAFETINNGGRTIMGNSAELCAKKLTDAGADAVGANCGKNLTLEDIARIVGWMKAATRLPIIAKPNAGIPEGGVYRMEPLIFAKGISRCRAAGARLVGGCCGTTPEHIRAMVNENK